MYTYPSQFIDQQISHNAHMHNKWDHFTTTDTTSVTTICRVSFHTALFFCCCLLCATLFIAFKCPHVCNQHVWYVLLPNCQQSARACVNTDTYETVALVTGAQTVFWLGVGAVRFMYNIYGALIAWNCITRCALCLVNAVHAHTHREIICTPRITAWSVWFARSLVCENRLANQYLGDTKHYWLLCAKS